MSVVKKFSRLVSQLDRRGWSRIYDTMSSRNFSWVVKIPMFCNWSHKAWNWQLPSLGGSHAMGKPSTNSRCCWTVDTAKASKQRLEMMGWMYLFSLYYQCIFSSISNVDSLKTTSSCSCGLDCSMLSCGVSHRRRSRGDPGLQPRSIIWAKRTLNSSQTQVKITKVTRCIHYSVALSLKLWEA